MWRVSLFSLAVFFLASQGVLAEESVPPAGTKYEYNNSTINNYGYSGTPEQDDSKYGIRTFRDPETGDRITQVRSKPQQPQSQQQIPIYVEPRVFPRY